MPLRIHGVAATIFNGEAAEVAGIVIVPLSVPGVLQDASPPAWTVGDCRLQLGDRRIRAGVDYNVSQDAAPCYELIVHWRQQTEPEYIQRVIGAGAQRDI